MEETKSRSNPLPDLQPVEPSAVHSGGSTLSLFYNKINLALPGGSRQLNWKTIYNLLLTAF
jgi:hypothetical protein